MYKAITRFEDKTDKFHIYEENNPYPRKGLKPNDARITELLGDGNDAGRPLIVAVETKKKEGGGE